MNSNYIKCIKVFLLSLFSDLGQNFEYDGNFKLKDELRNIFKIKKKYGFVYSGFLYKEKLIKDIIWKIKFRGDQKLLEIFEDFIGQIVNNLVKQENISISDEILIIPIPLHKKRLRERSFNQSDIIAHLVLESLRGFNVKLEKKLLKRVNNNEKQSWKNKKGRLNRKNYFKADSSFNLKNKIIIIVDDVVTTGTTIEIAKGAILSAGTFCKVIAITIAY